jgi:hypothetical protein
MRLWSKFHVVFPVMIAWACFVPAGTQAVTRYVDAYSLGPASPYVNPINAAFTIQEAVNVSAPGDEIVVYPGVYAEGEFGIAGQAVSNRVVLTNSVTVRSQAGAASTIILGRLPAGDQGVRCVYMTEGSQLIDFTVAQGGTRISDGIWSPDCSGGGIFMAGGGLVSDCLVCSNKASFGGGIFCASGQVVNCQIWTNDAVSAPASGGGIYCAGGGQVRQCTIYGNRGMYGAGVFCDEYGLVENCTLRKNRSSRNAGGVFCASNGMVRNCQISGNYASLAGGGSYCWQGGDLRNNLILTNSAQQHGGGVFLDRGGLLESCTIARNQSVTAGGGLYTWSTGEVWNSIIYLNSSGYGSNYACMGNGPRYVYSCLAPLPANNQISCLGGNPIFERQGSYQLGSSSPCIDKGINQAWMLMALDSEQRPRIWINRVDIGATERNPPNALEDTDNDGMPDAWEWEYFGHVTNTVPALDDDGDCYDAYSEFIAGTDPHNASSFFGIDQSRKASQTNNVIRWPSVAGRVYSLYRTTNLLNQTERVPLVVDMPATPPYNSYTDTFTTARCGIYILHVRKP